MTNITKTQLDSYIATNSLIKGKTYEISDCHRPSNNYFNHSNS